jgi:Leucine-rich repeat (LRR) protein
MKRKKISAHEKRLHYEGQNHRKKRKRPCEGAIISLVLSLGLTLLGCEQLAWPVSAQIAPPIPDDCVSSTFENGLALTCSLSAINSANEKTNFSVVPNDHTLSLTVKCRDSALSSLDPMGFISLKHLKRLTLEGCHLRAIPAQAFFGLTKLRTLNIKTRNAGVLSVSSDAFLGLEDLENLDLSGNYIRYLSPNALCPLQGLQTLNLSRNEIASLADLGNSLDCLHKVKSVDLSFNQISFYAGLTAMDKLQELRLGNNRIRDIKKDAMRKHSQLRFVDFNNNRLASLPEDIFDYSRDLKWISLSNNSLNFLPSNVFKIPADSLEVLDLSGNQLRTLSPPLLSNLKSLTSLDLSNNEIVSLDSPGTLGGLDQLQSLKLDNNKLARLTPLSLPSLRSLSLSHNEIGGRLTPTRLLSRMPLLSHLLLDHNQIEELPSQIFSNSSRITVLDLSHNRLRGNVPYAISLLHNLQSLSLSHNKLNDLSQVQLPALWRLQVSENRISNISKSHFKNLPALQVLDLSDNRITEIENDAFGENKPLKAIRLDGNKLSRMDGLFHDLPNLSWLNVSANQISVFDYGMLPKSLLWLDIHQNKISILENYFGIENESHLSHVDASFNQIREIGPQNIPNNVETLLLNDNKISTLVPYTFFKKMRVKKVDLSVNRLESIDRNALRLSSPELSEGNDVEKPLAQFFLGGNPIRCDCHMAWFKSINDVDLNTLQVYPKVADLESIYCELIYSRERTFVPLVDARTEEFLCDYKTHCFALCHCCDYDACDCEMTCPTNCTCYHDTTWSKNIAECSNSDFKDLPDQLPMDATEIFLDGNNIGELHSHTFIGRKNLKVLFLNNSLLSAVENHTFNGLGVLELLHLEDNSISKLQGDEFHGLTKLRELYLQNNQIKTVNNATFRTLSSLQILFIHGNQIMDFPVWEFNVNPSLTQIRLDLNPWTCECQFTQNFRTWIGQNREKLFQVDQILCFFNDSPDTSVKIIDSGNISQCQKEDSFSNAAGGGNGGLLIPNLIQQKDLSLSSSDPKNESGNLFHEFLPIFLSVLSIVILLIVVVIAVFVYRNEMRIWLYSKYGIRFFHRIDGMVDDLDKIFDAFVTYSAKDEVFVRQVLAPELELESVSQPQQHQYKLCLLYRDLPIQQNAYHMADTIVQATEASKRSIIVLSEHFIKSEWSRYDFKSGLHQALRSNGRTRSKKGQLIVILLGNVANRRDLDPDLRLYLKSGVVVQWGDKLFWEKLRYAMPDSSSGRHLSYGHNHHHHHLMSAFSPDTSSFRYETYHPHNSTYSASVGNVPTSSRSVGGGSSIYQSIGTPDEQDSTRTMTIHI